MVYILCTHKVNIKLHTFHSAKDCSPSPHISITPTHTLIQLQETEKLISSLMHVYYVIIKISTVAKKVRKTNSQYSLQQTPSCRGDVILCQVCKHWQNNQHKLDVCSNVHNTITEQELQSSYLWW